MNKGFCFLLKFLTGFENNRLLSVFPEVFGMLIGRLHCVLSGETSQAFDTPATVDFFEGVGHAGFLCSFGQGFLCAWNGILLLLRLAASPMAPCCIFLSTFHCWQTHGLFIQNILVSWIQNSLKVPGSGSVMSHCCYNLSTRHMQGLHSVFVEWMRGTIENTSWPPSST